MYLWMMKTSVNDDDVWMIKYLEYFAISFFTALYTQHI
jgi:hypothetical protein